MTENFPCSTLTRWLLPLTGAAALFFTSCDKVWEVGQKLKAPEEPEAPAPIPEPVKAAPIEVPPVPEVEKKPEINEDAQVSILGYHDFSDRRSTNDMIIEVEKFREQMETLKQNGVSVIPMSDYLAWKRGEKSIPDPAVVITMDDGWEAVYTHAFPVLKEYGYPFSVYLYRNYVNTGGRSLSWEQIREMMENGAEVGSHSVSHYWLTKPKGSTAEEKEDWLKVELKGSLDFLNENLNGQVLPVFAYPYGAHNERVRQLAEMAGYELAVTVAPGKAEFDDGNFEIGRYIVHGSNDVNFKYAMTFGGGTSLATGQSLLAATETEAGADEEPLVSTWPGSGQEIDHRLPLIEADVSKLEGILPESVRMKVSGFGDVVPKYDPEGGKITFQVPQRLRTENTDVSIQLRRQGQSSDDRITWGFKINRKALYLQELDLAALAPEPGPEEPGEAVIAPSGGEPSPPVEAEVDSTVPETDPAEPATF